MELQKEHAKIVEVTAKLMERKVILIMVLSNRKVLVYEGLNEFTNSKNERFRFKIVQSQALRKYVGASNDGEKEEEKVNRQIPLI